MARPKLFMVVILTLVPMWFVVVLCQIVRQNCLTVAVRRGSLNSVRLLLNIGADPNHWPETRYPNVRRENLKADREAIYTSHSPIMIAAKQGRADVVKTLLNHGALFNVGFNPCRQMEALLDGITLACKRRG